MAELATLARPYSNAVFEVAKEEGRLDLWSRSLAVLVRTLQEPEVEPFIASPIHSPAKKAITLTDILGDQLSESTRRFVHVLAENRRLELLPEIQQGFEERLEEEQQTLTVEITTAVDLSDDEKKRFTTTLQDRFQRDISLATEVDPDVLGGALIRAGDTVLDGTVRGKLEKLRNQMQRT